MSVHVRRPLVVANWKMNLTERESVSLTGAILATAGALPARVEVALAPSFPALRAVADRLTESPVHLAAQDVHEQDRGAFTGEVSAGMLAEIGVRYLLAGHSERRHLLGEGDERVGRKVAAAWRHGIVPILCVGEKKSERDAGATLEVVRRQLCLGLADLSAAASPGDLVVAYEPVWAIGTGVVATTEQVREVHRLLREQLAEIAGTAAAEAIRILYGGSVTPGNAPGLLALPEVDGALVGGASLDAEAFASILTAAA